MDKLIVLNCRYNFKIEKNGKCYCSKCMLNINKEVKEKIKKNGCKVYLSKEVQGLFKEK